MVKHFCDICGIDLSTFNTVDNVTLLTNVIEIQFGILPSYDEHCEICISCAHTITQTIDMMKKGKEVIYK